jgi:hypothetical protein
MHPVILLLLFPAKSVWQIHLLRRLFQIIHNASDQLTAALLTFML